MLAQTCDSLTQRMSVSCLLPQSTTLRLLCTQSSLIRDLCLCLCSHQRRLPSACGIDSGRCPACDVAHRPCEPTSCSQCMHTHLEHLCALFSTAVWRMPCQHSTRPGWLSAGLAAWCRHLTCSLQTVPAVLIQRCLGMWFTRLGGWIRESLEIRGNHFCGFSQGNF